MLFTTDRLLDPGTRSRSVSVKGCNHQCYRWVEKPITIVQKKNNDSFLKYPVEPITGRE